MIDSLKNQKNLCIFFTGNVTTLWSTAVNIKLLFIIVFLSALSLICYGSVHDASVAGSQCPAQEPIHGKALKYYTFKTLPVSSPFGCLYHCHYEVRCQSYNYVINKNICEMNSRTKEANPWQFVSDPARFYMKRGAHRGKLTTQQYCNKYSLLWKQFSRWRI